MQSHKNCMTKTIQFYFVLSLETQRKRNKIIKQWNWIRFLFLCDSTPRFKGGVSNSTKVIKNKWWNKEIFLVIYVPDGHGLFKELKPALRFWNPPTMQLLYRIMFGLISVRLCTWQISLLGEVKMCPKTCPIIQNDKNMKFWCPKTIKVVIC